MKIIVYHSGNMTLEGGIYKAPCQSRMVLDVACSPHCLYTQGQDLPVEEMNGNFTQMIRRAIDIV